MRTHHLDDTWTVGAMVAMDLAQHVSHAHDGKEAKVEKCVISDSEGTSNSSNELNRKHRSSNASVVCGGSPQHGQPQQQRTTAVQTK